jgi:uncharacterized protein YfaP (DUF2135 family)
VTVTRPRLLAVPAALLVAALAGLSFADDAPRPAPAPPPPPAPPAPLSVRIDTPRGGQTTERIVSVSGTVTGYAGDRLTLVFNGVPMSVAVTSGRFQQPQVLSPGLNALRAVVSRDGVMRDDSVSVFARVPAKDLRVTLTWDTPGTDVDLWVTSPDGEKVMYSHREGKAGGTLDTDVTSGFGPETYTQARVVRGTFRIQAHAYRIDRPTRIVVTTIRDEGTPDEERRTFRAVLWRTGDVAEVGDLVVR